MTNPRPGLRALAFAAVLAALAVVAHEASGGAAARPEIVGQMDALLSGAYRPGAPGAAVLVMKDGMPLLRKGYGLANLELGVPIRPEMVFRIGSITKQFTAVGILMLVKEGKLALDDEITRFLPDYPTHGQKITVETLLTHTSGIQSYTDMPSWLALWRKDFTVPELVALFKNEPMRFKPGEKWEYDNSGYILLGAILEKVSGKSYADSARRRFFEPLGMKHSYYGADEPIIPGRVTGYEKRDHGFGNAAYLSMTQPYAPGAARPTPPSVWRGRRSKEPGRPPASRTAAPPATVTAGASGSMKATGSSSMRAASMAARPPGCACRTTTSMSRCSRTAQASSHRRASWR